MKILPYKDKVVIITGASAGIGKALAIQLAAQGARLSIAARRIERLNEVAADCRKLGAEILVVQTDVAEESQCKALIEKTVKKFGRLDMLINNAGLAASALFADFLDLSLFYHTMGVNFNGAVNCTYYALPHLKGTKGRVVNISSLGGKVSIPYNTPYCSSKFALHGFSDSLRTELKKDGVSVTVICPWWVITEFHEAQQDKNGSPRGSRGRAMYSKRMMTADQCAQITLHAAEKRRREVLMGPGGFAVWAQLIAPGLLEWLTMKVFLEPAVKRARSKLTDK